MVGMQVWPGSSLPLGATFGAILAHDGLNASWHGRLLLAHETVNILGFVGLTVVGTLMTLWPTMLSACLASFSTGTTSPNDVADSATTRSSGE